MTSFIFDPEMLTVPLPDFKALPQKAQAPSDLLLELEGFENSCFNQFILSPLAYALMHGGRGVAQSEALRFPFDTVF